MFISGWALLDNVVILNGTVFIIANDRSQFPDIVKMYSSGAPMLSDPETWKSKDATDRDMQIVTQGRARELFGERGTRIGGVTFLCNDAPQCTCLIVLTEESPFGGHRH